MSSLLTLGMFGLGGTELIMIMAIIMLLFGGKKIPEMMKGLGKGIKDFKDASNGVNEPVKEETQAVTGKVPS